MMNYVPHLFTGSETMVFAANVLIQATLVIVLTLLLGRLLQRQPALRHSVLLGGLICVLLFPTATYLADRMDTVLISIPWPSIPDSHPQPQERDLVSAHSCPGRDSRHSSSAVCASTLVGLA